MQWKGKKGTRGRKWQTLKQPARSFYVSSNCDERSHASQFCNGNVVVNYRWFHGPMKMKKLPDHQLRVRVRSDLRPTPSRGVFGSPCRLSEKPHFFYCPVPGRRGKFFFPRFNCTVELPKMTLYYPCDGRTMLGSGFSVR